MESSCDYPLSLNPSYSTSDFEVIEESGMMSVVLWDSSGAEYPCSLPYTYVQYDGITEGQLTIDGASLKNIWQDEMIDDIKYSDFFKGKSDDCLNIKITGI